MSPPATVPADLLDRIPLTARIVLEVGCGDGALGAAYKRRNPRARYFGVEPDAEAARIAATRLDVVATAEGEADIAACAGGLEAGSVDCLVYGGVLARLRDPWEVLRRHAPLLSPAGVVLVRLPNMEHWRFAERLLRGTWDYEAEAEAAAGGLFAADTLRWFTAEATRRGLRAAGLMPLDAAPCQADPEGAESCAEALAPGLSRLGIDPAAWQRRAAPRFLLWRATRRAVEPLAVSATMLAPVGGVSEVSVVEPARALAAEPGLRVEVLAPHAPVPPAATGPRICILHRPLLAGEDGLASLRRLIAGGNLVVCEFDDHPDFIPWLQGIDLLNFRAVHAVQTSTAPLAEVLKRQNPEVAVFPNAVFHLPDVRNYADPGRLTLLFAGLNREEDWPPCLEALNAVAAMAGERLFFRIVNDRGLFEALRTPHKSFTPRCGYETYRDLLASAEISFMPLRDTPFNRCKSDLKFIEAAAHRVTALASAVVYGGSVQDGGTGLLFRGGAELQRRLAWLVANPAAARALADAARAYVARERMLAYQIGARAAWYRSLWARRDELQAALLARVPELAAGAEATAG